MKKIILLFICIIIFLPSIAQAEVVDDPFTIYIQGKLIDLGLLEGEPTGINDKATQQAIKAFQEKAGLVVDGMVGVNTFPKLLLGERAYLQTSPTTTVPVTPTTTIPTGPDTEPPVWDETQPPYASEIGSLFNLNMPSVTDNVGIVSYEVYVNGALSTHVSISESRLLVTPNYDMTCADQLIYVIAFDDAGNSSQSPTFTIPKSDLCISSSSSSSSSSQTYFAVTFGGSGQEQGIGIAVDSSGNSYITGSFQGTVDFGSGAKTARGNKDIFVLKLNSSGSLQWVETYGSTLNDEGNSIAVDSSGNIYVTGYFQGNVVAFGSGITAGVGNDIFVLKLNSSGTFQWVKTYGGGSSDVGKGIAVDSSGNIYVTGFHGSSVDFGGGGVTFRGNADIFVLKLNSSGTFQWVNTYSGTSNDYGIGIAVDSSGNIYVTGYFSGTVVDFGSGGITSAGSADIFVLKLNSSGSLQWVKTFGGSSDDVSEDIAVDSSGNSYVTGYFYGTVNFGSGNKVSEGLADIFVLKLNSSGTFQWVNTYGNTGYDDGYGIAVDSTGNSYVTGYYNGIVDFGGGGVTAGVGNDIFVLKLNSSGAFQWVNTYGSTSSDAGKGIAVDSSGNSYVTGFFQGTVDFGSGSETAVSLDCFVLKLNSSGGGIE